MTGAARGLATRSLDLSVHRQHESACDQLGFVVVIGAETLMLVLSAAWTLALPWPAS